MQRGLQQLLSLRTLLCGAAQPLSEGLLYGQALPSLPQALQQLRGLKKQANEVRAAAAAAAAAALGQWSILSSLGAKPAPTHPCCSFAWAT